MTNHAVFTPESFRNAMRNIAAELGLPGRAQGSTDGKPEDAPARPDKVFAL